MRAGLFAVLVASVAAHPTSSNLYNDLGQRLFKRDLQCSAADGPAKPTTLMAELYHNSPKEYADAMTILFAEMDPSMDGAVSKFELHQYLKKITKTRAQNATVSVANLMALADTDENKSITEKEFRAGMDQLMINTKFLGCEKKCSAATTKLQQCQFFDPTEDAEHEVLQRSANMLLTSCRVGANKDFDAFGECVAKTVCEDISKCFKKVTECESDDSSCTKADLGVTEKISGNSTVVTMDSDAARREQLNERIIRFFRNAFATVSVGLGVLMWWVPFVITAFPAVIGVFFGAVLTWIVTAVIMARTEHNSVTLIGPST